MKLNHKSILDILAYAVCALFMLIGSTVSLHRYWQYEVSYVDFGLYDRVIWQVSRFQEPVTNHFVHGKINVLGDHVTPSVFLISPLYWLTDRSEMILIVQAFVVGVSGFFLYGLAKHILKNKLMSFSILTCYFLFLGLQNAVITEFHELTVMTLPLMIALWAIVKNKPVVYFIFLIITLGFKEITVFLGVGIGIALILLKKEWRKYGLFTILISLLWGFIAFKIVLPHFSNGQYLYATFFPDSTVEKALALVDHPMKRRTLLYSFLSFSFLPIFAPQFWLAMLQDYATRFLPLHFMTRWDLTMHYNAQSAVLLAVSSIFGMKRLLKFSLIKKYSTLLACLMMINALILFRFILNGPFMLAFNPAFYRHTNEFAFLNDMVRIVPKDASVMTHNNLATRFTHQPAQLLTHEYINVKPDYILMDLREGQSPNNFFGSANIQGIYQQVSKDSNYEVVYKTNEQYVFKRKGE